MINDVSKDVEVCTPQTQMLLDNNGNPAGGFSSGTGFAIVWQHGVIPENGINGASLEEVIEAVIERVKFLNDSAFKCDENERTLGHLMAAIKAQEDRTSKRKGRKVEGTYVV